MTESTFCYPIIWQLYDMVGRWTGGRADIHTYFIRSKIYPALHCKLLTPMV